jgi:RimK family alpha-L-glutamate ligase
MRLLRDEFRIVIFAEPGDGHARQLIARFHSLGAACTATSIKSCMFDTTASGGIIMGGRSPRLPDGIVVRTIPDGTFEAVTRRLGLLHGLRDLGVLVWNDARAVERCVDKSMTSFLLARNRIPTPATWIVETESQAAQVVRKELTRGRLVQKPLFGSQGRGLRLIERMEDLSDSNSANGVYYLQRFIENGGGAFHDFRVFVVAGRAIGAMRRTHSHWITNVKQGGVPSPTELDEELAKLAVRSAAAVGADFCGVDIIRDATGLAQVLEVNSMPAWSGLQKVIQNDVAHEIAAAMLAALGSRRAARKAM